MVAEAVERDGEVENVIKVKLKVQDVKWSFISGDKCLHNDKENLW